MEILFILVWLINIVFLLLKKKNILITFVSIVYIIGLFFWSSNSGDYDSNRDVYIYEIFDNLEIGYIFLIKLAKNFTLDFQIFQGIVCSISFLITLFVFGRFSKNYQLFFSIYLIYQCLYDMDTMKNFIMRAILFVALLMLIKKKRLLFIFLVLLSSLFHRIGIIYLPLVFVYNIKGFNLKYLFAYFMALFIVCIIVYFIANSNGTIDVIINSLGLDDAINTKNKTYLSDVSKIGFAMYILLHTFNIIYMIVNKKILNYNMSNKYKGIILVIYFANIFVTICFPLLIINNVFFRIFNNIYLINYIMYAISIDKLYGKKYYTNTSLLLLINLAYRIPFVHSSAEFDRVFH